MCWYVLKVPYCCFYMVQNSYLCSFMELRQREPELTDVESRTAGLIGQALQGRQAMYMEGLSTDDITAEIDTMCVR